MGLADATKIDIVMQPRPGHPEDGRLVLIMIDGERRDDATRLDLLLKKLQAYVHYAASKQCRHEHHVRASDVRIFVVCTPDNPPLPTMLQIQQVQPHAQPENAVPILFKTYGKGFP